MSKLTVALKAVKLAAPHVKAGLVLVAGALADKEYKHKAKVDKALNGAYKAAELVERIL